MRILLPTGSTTVEIVKKAAAGFDADVRISGEIASFLTPHALRSMIKGGQYDLVIVPGMCTASFEQVERDMGVPIFRGPKHAADLSLILPVLETIHLSRTIPADEFLAINKAEEAIHKLAVKEQEAGSDFLLRGIKIGSGSRMKVLAEVMDAHYRDDIRDIVLKYFSAGADIVDLGFGFDALPEDVIRVFSLLEGIDKPLAADTQDPDLIRAALCRADIILSLHEKNIPVVGEDVMKAGVAAVVVPGKSTLAKNILMARYAGIACIIADPLIQPVGSGLVASLKNFKSCKHPLFFGAGNVTELLDADSVGVNALLAGMAMELGAAVIFTSEHSDKTRGSIREMRRATEMMALAAGCPYPKDLGIDLLVLKEKRRRREPPVEFTTVAMAKKMPDEIAYDPKGSFRIGIEDEDIIAVVNGKAVKGKHWHDVLHTILLNGDISLLDHAGYLGRELYKAELAIRYGRSFEQDGEF